MKQFSEPFDPALEKKLALIMVAPTRDPKMVARRRANFLAEAETLAQPITGLQNRRHNGWIDPIIAFLKQRERSPMFTTFISILVVLALLASGGVTVFASQESLPGQALYQVKLVSEDLRLSLTNSSREKIDLNLAFAQRRISELTTLLGSNAVPTDALPARLQTQLDHSLALAVGLDDAQLAPVLNHTQQQLKRQLQTLQQARLDEDAPPQAGLVLARAREMVQEHLNWVETGLSDPASFRNQWRHRNSLDPVPATGQPGGIRPGPQSSQTPGSGAGPGPLATCTCTPGSGNGPGPYVTGTPAPGSGFGPGPGSSSTGTPASGSGYGPGPGPSATRTPGSSYGPGPGPSSTRTSGSGEGSGPHPTQPADDTDREPQPTAAREEKGGPGSGPGSESGSTRTPQTDSGPEPTPKSGGGGDGGDGGNGSMPQPTSESSSGEGGRKGRP